MIHILYVGIGGFFGSIGRYLIAKFINENYPAFPYGTLIVNVLGCLLIGFIVYSLPDWKSLSTEIRDLIIIGFIGGFTTMSAFAFESFRLAELNQLMLSIINVVISITLCIGAVFIGKLIAQIFLK